MARMKAKQEDEDDKTVDQDEDGRDDEKEVLVWEEVYEKEEKTGSKRKGIDEEFWPRRTICVTSTIKGNGS